MPQKRSDRIEFLKPDHLEPFGLKDLSESGAAFLSKKSLKEGGEINLLLNSHKLSARVIYCREQVGGCKVGVQFLRLDAKLKGEIAELVDQFSRGKPIQFELC